jgi:hypothetical protein
MTSLKGPLVLGAILYEGFELLDLYGPLEMFGNLKPQVEIVTVAEEHHRRCGKAQPGSDTILEQPGGPVRHDSYLWTGRKGRSWHSSSDEMDAIYHAIKEEVAF